MRFSSTAVLALPLLAAAAENPFQQYKAQFQNFLGSFGSVGSPDAAADSDAASASAAAGGANAASQSKDTPSASAAKSSGAHAEVLTLENWKDVLYAPVKADATVPEEWWVLLTGRNKTCFGHCIKVEEAFNETVDKFATLPKAPHAAILNCDDQPVLCNSWSAGTGNLWVFEMLPAPAAVDVYTKRLNLTTTVPQTLLDLHAQGSKEGFRLHDGYFHPFDGPLAKNGLAVPAGYFFWIFNAIPSWAMMLGVSFFSRSIMSRRMEAPGRGAAPAAAPGNAARS